MINNRNKRFRVGYIGNGIADDIRQILEEEGHIDFIEITDTPESFDNRTDKNFQLLILDEKINACELNGEKVCRLDSFIRTIRTRFHNSRVLILASAGSVLEHFSNVAHYSTLQKRPELNGLLAVVRNMLHLGAQHW